MNAPTPPRQGLWGAAPDPAGATCLPGPLVVLGAVLVLLAGTAAAQTTLVVPRAFAHAGPGDPGPIVACPKHEPQPTRRWTASLRCDNVAYGLQHWACYHESHKPYAYATEGLIGMEAPEATNWYHNGFFNFELDGDSAGRYPVKDVRTVETGERAACDFIWEMPVAWVRVRFVLVPGCQALFAAITQYPKGEASPKLKVSLHCYPSGYFHNGRRVVLTGTREFRSSTQAELTPASEWGLVLYDEVCDVDVNGGTGGCGGLVVPDPVGAATVNVGAYAVSWTLEAKPGEREMRFAFWKGLQKKNAELAPFLRGQFEPTLAQLRGLDFTPVCLKPDRLAALRAEVTRLVTETQGCDAEKAAVTAAIAKLDAVRPQLDQAPNPLSAETECLQALRDLDAKLWQLRMSWVFSE